MEGENEEFVLFLMDGRPPHNNKALGSVRDSPDDPGWRRWTDCTKVEANQQWGSFSR